MSSAGDRCVLLQGTYRETVRPRSGLTFEAAPNAIVTFSGTERVTGWTLDGAGYWSAAVTLPSAGLDGTPILANQLFLGEEMLHEARWPNPSGNPLRPNWAVMANGSGGSVVLDANLPATIGTDAIVRIYGGTNAFIHQTARVTSAVQGRLDVSLIGQSLCPNTCIGSGTRYFVEGGSNVGLLDIEKEWLYLPAAGRLYLRSPGGANPDTLDVNAKRRNYAFDLGDASDVTIRRVRLHAASVRMGDQSARNTLDGLSARYISHFKTLDLPNASDLKVDEGPYNIVASHALDTGLIIRGSNHKLVNSILEYSAGNGILLLGSGNLVENNLIREMGYGGGYATAVNLGGTSNRILRNTIYNVGRDLITIDWHVAGTSVTGNEIGYNRLFKSGLTSPDSGALYTCCALNAEGSLVHHNRISDQEQGGFGKGIPVAGIYLDNRSERFQVYQNALSNTGDIGILLNGNGDYSIAVNRGSRIFRNTIGATAPVSISIRDVTDATGTRIEENRITGTVLRNNSPFNAGVEQNNSATATGANENAAASVGCSLSVCSGGPIMDSVYRIVAKHSGRSLDVNGGIGAQQNGAPVIQYDYGGSANQQWSVQSLPDGTYQITARHSGKCLDVNGGVGAVGNGASVQQWQCGAPQDNQRWLINDLGDGSYSIVAKHSGKCLDVSGGIGATGNSVPVNQWACGRPEDNQRWYFMAP